jgi:hypothetical protein
MFIGFIAVIIVLLVIVAVMSTGTLGTGSDANYHAEAAKVKVLVSNFKAESNFYYVGHNESFLGINISYFKDVGFDIGSIQNGTLSAADWLGLSTDYTGDYFLLKGAAGGHMAIIVESTSDGKGMIIKIVGEDKLVNATGVAGHDQIIDSVDAKYPMILEKVLSADSEYLGS